MKFRRLLSWLIFSLGCALSFIGLMAIVLPAFQNSRLQLVLAGFELTASNPLAESINRFICFALVHKWSVLGMGLSAVCIATVLLLRFSPKPIPCTKAISVPPESIPFQSQTVAKPNPFARAVCYQLPPASHIQYSMRADVTNERERIDEPAPDLVMTKSIQPYFSPRLADESHAIEAKTGTPSQSGSRILIRTSPKGTPEPQNESSTSKPESSVFSPVSVPPSPSQPVSPRIRSTMGRHTH